MNETLWGVLLGGGIGLLGGVIGTWITTRGQGQRQMVQLGFQLGLEEWKAHSESAQNVATMTGKPIDMLPPFGYVHFNAMIFKKLAQGKLSPKAIKEIGKERDKNLEAIHEFKSKQPT